MTGIPRVNPPLNELLSYLDSVESTLASDFVLPDLKDAEMLHEQVYSRISELEATLAETQRRESEVRAELLKILSSSSKEKTDLKDRLAKRLDSQKSKYDEAIKRHQALLDNLIREKEELARQCGHLAKKAVIARQEAMRREKEMQEEAAKAIAQQRELAIAQERARLNKVLEQKAREIKEDTVKGLEPQVQSLIAKQKREIETIKTGHEEALRIAKVAADERYEEERQHLLEQLDRDRKSELELAEERLQKQLERERDLHRAELDHLALRLKTAESDRALMIQRANEENDALLEEARGRWNAELAAERLRAAQEMEKIDEKVEAARRSVALKKDALLVAAGQKIRKEMEAAAIQHNEKKLEMVVKKLEEETNARRKQLEVEAERRVDEAQTEARERVTNLMEEKQRCQMELDELRKSVENEKSLCARFEEENERLVREIENHREVKEKLRVEISCRERDIRDLEAENLRKEQERREKDEEEKRSLREELNLAREEFAKQKTVWAHEREMLEQKNQEDLRDVSKKVKGLLEMKEQTIQSLKDQLAQAQVRLREIEAIFQQKGK
jgi:5-azacytidine-induced protein 1